MAMLMLCTVLVVTCKGSSISRMTRIELQRLSIIPGCRYNLGCRFLLQATCISLTSTVWGSGQQIAGISRYICFSRLF